MASTYLTRTPSSTGNRRTLTISYWLKRGNITTSDTQCVLNAGILSNGDNHTFCGFDYNIDKAMIQTTTSNSTVMILRTSSLFRDTSAWYHFVWKIDTTQATESNRVKLYVNGVEHSLTGTFPSQNQDTWYNYADEHVVGVRFSNYFDGSLSHFHFIDGTAYDASAFGETDSTTGEWKINTSPSVTYGTNGFFILKDGNSVTDQSGNGNNFTVGGGTLTNTEDNPSNVFASGNPLLGQSITWSNGNNTISTGADWESSVSTLAASSGKYYAEFKFISGSYCNFGVTDIDDAMKVGDAYPGVTGSLYSIGHDQTNSYYINGSTVANGSTFTTGDIISIALDMDNGKVHFAKNGVWELSSDPANNTGGLSLPSTNYYQFSHGNYSSSSSANFGNGYFGTTAVASAGTNASGNGIFEYDVPTGYTALSTKGLNL